MENYLTGRGGNDDIKLSEVDSSFRPLLIHHTNDQVQQNADEENLESEGSTEVIYNEEDCPKVEVTSVDSKPKQIVIHLPDGRLLKINCEY